MLNKYVSRKTSGRVSLMQKPLSHKITQKFLKDNLNKNCYNKYHIVDPNYSFVKNEKYDYVMVERIKESSKNCLTLYPKLLFILNKITKLSLGCRKGLGETYIAKQLQNCKELILIRNIYDATITHYLRFDVFVDLPSAPCGLAMYKVPDLQSSNIITELSLKILKDELENRVTLSDLNPGISLVLRTDNPRLYQMRAKLTDKIYPDLHKVKSSIDNFLLKQIKSLILHNDFDPINELLQKKLIMTRDRKICYKIKDVIAAMPALTLNLKSLKMHQFCNSPIINLLTSQLDAIYKNHIPAKYISDTQHIIRKMFGSNKPHNYDLLIAKNMTPNIKINKSKEEANDPVINDLYEYYTRADIRDCLMINFQINLKDVNKRLNTYNNILDKIPA